MILGHWQNKAQVGQKATNACVKGSLFFFVFIMFDWLCSSKEITIQSLAESDFSTILFAVAIADFLFDSSCLVQLDTASVKNRLELLLSKKENRKQFL